MEWRKLLVTFTLSQRFCGLDKTLRPICVFFYIHRIFPSACR
jgi:hypothetical protein